MRSLCRFRSRRALTHLGKKLDRSLQLVNGRGEVLPFRSASFDHVIARGSIPYTKHAPNFRELRRVLADGGKLWISLHDVRYVLKQFATTNLKGTIYLVYVLINGLAFSLFGRSFRFINGSRECFQTEYGFVQPYGPRSSK